jgi:hypothetical protein
VERTFWYRARSFFYSASRSFHVYRIQCRGQRGRAAPFSESVGHSARRSVPVTARRNGGQTLFSRLGYIFRGSLWNSRVHVTLAVLSVAV